MIHGTNSNTTKYLISNFLFSGSVTKKDHTLIFAQQILNEPHNTRLKMCKICEKYGHHKMFLIAMYKVTVLSS